MNLKKMQMNLVSGITNGMQISGMNIQIRVLQVSTASCHTLISPTGAYGDDPAENTNTGYW